MDCLTKLIRDADDTICNMKNFKGAADLSQGFAAARFIVNIVKGKLLLSVRTTLFQYMKIQIQQCMF